VDFGTTQNPVRGPTFTDTAQHIKDHTGGQLDVVVATHRHADHISGFAGAKTDKVMDTFEPSLVIRPWTDDPDSPRDANAPGDLDAASRAFLRTLDARTEWLRNLAASPRGQQTPQVRLPADLADQLKNPEAIDRLDRWSTPGHGLYVRAGDHAAVDEVLPGVTVQVLGPPTLAQVPGLANEAFNHPEFWVAAADNPPPVRQSSRRLADAYHQLAAPHGRGEAAWILSRLHDDERTALFQVARAFDEALNNTSVILLVRAGSRSVLLTGDAQIENWGHVLALATSRTPAGRALRDRLADINLYKVGHHGSRNATPRTLYAMWETRGRVPADMVSLMSTLPGKHGTKNPVPKQNLVDALEDISTLHRTDTLEPDQHYLELHAPTSGRARFELVEP
jgi:hypothetical protein